MSPECRFPRRSLTCSKCGSRNVELCDARPDAVFLAWYSPDIEDREPDFIPLSPDSGLIVLEVKDWLAARVLGVSPEAADFAARPFGHSSAA